MGARRGEPTAEFSWSSGVCSSRGCPLLPTSPDTTSALDTTPTGCSWSSRIGMVGPPWLDEDEPRRHPREVEAPEAKRQHEGRPTRSPTGQGGTAPRSNQMNADTPTVDQRRQAAQTQPANGGWDGWQRDAACRGRMDLDWIDPTTSQQARCRAVCLSCPVVTTCRTYALVNGEPWGIWGGLDPVERAAIAGRDGHPIPAVLPAHGTNPRYAKHGCRCVACRRAHTTYERTRRSRVRRVRQTVERNSA
jgi:hypothetical protein